MEAVVLYSGGKDSSLAALILKKLGYDVKLLTANFGIVATWKYAAEAAEIIGFGHEIKTFGREPVEKAADIIVKDRFPNNGINFIHRYVLEEIAKEHAVIADGTRRDDRVPWLEFEEIRSFEDQYKVEYITPLRGIGYKTLNKLVKNFLIIEEGESDTISKSDYEAEIRSVLKERGYDTKKFFAEHKQSRVVGLKRSLMLWSEENVES